MCPILKIVSRVITSGHVEELCRSGLATADGGTRDRYFCFFSSEFFSCFLLLNTEESFR